MKPLTYLVIASLIGGSIYPAAATAKGGGNEFSIVGAAESGSAGGSGAAAEGEPAADAGADLKGHWAEAELARWMERGLLTGYPDGTVRPDKEITRAEFAALANRLFQFRAKANIAFADAADEWFRDELAAAVAAGYFSGYPDGTIRPNQLISRQEAAVAAARIVRAEASGEEAPGAFSDAGEIAPWAQAAVAAAMDSGIMRGYPDGTFRPHRAITRAEAVVMLEKAYRALHLIIDEPGVYGSETADLPRTIRGNAVINVPDVVLQNAVIEGDLLLGEGIGDGDVTLRNVTVRGATTIKGGGGESVHIENSVLASVVIDKADGNVRVVVTGATVVREVVLQSGATLQEIDLEDEGFGNITISLAGEGKVVLTGDFAVVEVAAPEVTLEIREGSVQNIVVDENAEGSKIEVQETATVENVTLNAAAEVAGDGAVVAAVVNAEGAVFQKMPETLSFGNPSVTVTVGDETIREAGVCVRQPVVRGV